MNNVLVSDGKTVTFSLDGKVDIPENESELGAIEAVATVLERFMEVKKQLTLEPGKYVVRAMIVVTEED